MKIILGATLALFVGAIVLGALSAEGADAKPPQEYVVRRTLASARHRSAAVLVALANGRARHVPTGSTRPRCYVASAWPASRTIQDGALVQGGIAQRVRFRDSERLGMLIATTSATPWEPVASGSYYRLRDIGVRCVREPCFSIRAFRLNTPRSMMVSGSI